MVRRVFLLCAMCSCAQDFDAFEPVDGAAPADVSAEAAADAAVESGVNDATVDVAQDVATKDVTPDVPVDVTPDAPVPCTETGAVQYGGHCYFLMSGAQDFNTSKANCKQANNAHLVTITTAGEQAAVMGLGSGSERWIGLFRSSGPAKDQFYAWVTGEGRNGYSDWAPGEPNGTGQCGTWLSTGLWNDEDCSISLASVCERE